MLNYHISLSLMAHKHTYTHTGLTSLGKSVNWLLLLQLVRTNVFFQDMYKRVCKIV